MRVAAAIVIVTSIFLIPAKAAPDSSVPEPYNVSDAYKIYTLLLPLEESYGFAKDTLMIKEETESAEISRACLTLDAARKFMESIRVFNRMQKKKWLLQRRFEIEKPYTVVGPGTISALPDYPPSSAAYVMMSSVGFNNERTRAVVYIGSSCGGLCGSWRHHLLEKVHGNWKEVAGITCAMYS